MLAVAPSALWSGDAESFLQPALQILSGEKSILSKRGIAYVLLLIPFVAYPQHFFLALALFQQTLMSAVILGAAVFARLLLGRASLPLIMIIGIGTGFYDVPIFVAHLIRNEVLQGFCLMMGVGFLGLALKEKTFFATTMSGFFFALTNLVKATQPLLIVLAAMLLWWRYRQEQTGWKVATVVVASYCAVHFGCMLASVTTGLKFKTVPYAGCELYSQVAHIGWVDSHKYPQLSAFIREAVEKYISLKKRDNGYVRHNIISLIEEYKESKGTKYPPVDEICRTLAFEILFTYPFRCAVDFGHKAVILHTRTGFKSKRPRLSHIQEAGAKAKEAYEELMIQQGFVKKFPINFEPAIALQNTKESTAYYFLKSLTLLALPYSWISIVTVNSMLSLVLLAFTRGWLRLWCLQLAFAWFFFILLHVTVAEPKDRFLVPMVSISFWLCTIGTYMAVKLLGKLATVISFLVFKTNSPNLE